MVYKTDWPIFPTGFFFKNTILVLYFIEIHVKDIYLHYQYTFIYQY